MSIWLGSTPGSSIHRYFVLSTKFIINYSADYDSVFSFLESNGRLLVVSPGFLKVNLCYMNQYSTPFHAKNFDINYPTTVNYISINQKSYRT